MSNLKEFNRTLTEEGKNLRSAANYLNSLAEAHRLLGNTSMFDDMNMLSVNIRNSIKRIDDGFLEALKSATKDGLNEASLNLTALTGAPSIRTEEDK